MLKPVLNGPASRFFTALVLFTLVLSQPLLASSGDPAIALETAAPDSFASQTSLDEEEPKEEDPIEIEIETLVASTLPQDRTPSESISVSVWLGPYLIFIEDPQGADPCIMIFDALSR